VSLALTAIVAQKDPERPSRFSLDDALDDPTRHRSDSSNPMISRVSQRKAPGQKKTFSRLQFARIG